MFKYSTSNCAPHARRPPANAGGRSTATHNSSCSPRPEVGPDFGWVMSWQSVVLVHKDRQSEPASIPQRSKVRSASRSKLPPVTRGLGRQVVDVPRARGPSGKANDRPTASHNLCPRRRQDVPCSRELDEVGGRCSSFPSISPVELFQAPIPAGHSRPAPPGARPPEVLLPLQYFYCPPPRPVILTGFLGPAVC